MVSVGVVRQRTSFDLSSLIHTSGISDGRRLISKSSCNQLGPNFHNSFAASSPEVNPWDGTSAELLLPER